MIPLFSVITVCYNAEQTIKDTITNVLSQTYRNFEYIIIDGKSQDNTLSIINNTISGNKDISIKVISEPDKGIYDAMNKGILMASGRYINFMNSGDRFFSFDTLAVIAQNLDKSAIVLFGDSALELDGHLYRVKCRPFYEHLPLHQSLGFNHQCTFVDTEEAKHMLFDLKYKLAADYNMIISLFRKGVKFQNLNTIVAVYDLTGVSAQHYKKHIKETFLVDYPNSRLNNLRAFMKYIRIYCKNYIISILSKQYPALLYKIRNNQTEKELIK